MRLALVLGKNSETVKPKLASVKDNLTIECFVDLQDFIKGSIARELYFDRIIVLSTLVNSSNSINSLYDYWNTYSRESEIVYLCRKSSDDELAKTFLSRFCSTSVTSMSVTSTTLHTLSESVVLPISKLSSAYGIENYLAIEVEQDSYEEPKPEPQPINNTQQQSQSPQSKEKRSFFGALFGKKKTQQEQENSQISNMNNDSLSTNNTVEDSQSIQGQELDESSSSNPYEDVQQTDDTGYTSNEYEYYGEQSSSDEVQYQEDFSDENSSFTSSQEENNIEEDFNQNQGFDFGVNISSEEQGYDSSLDEDDFSLSREESSDDSDFNFSQGFVFGGSVSDSNQSEEFNFEQDNSSNLGQEETSSDSNQSEEFNFEQDNSSDLGQEETSSDFNFSQDDVFVSEELSNEDEFDSKQSKSLYPNQDESANDFNFSQDDMSEDFSIEQSQESLVSDESSDLVSEDIVDDDFGDLTYSNDSFNEEPIPTSPEVEQQIVDDSNDDLSLGSAEDEYRSVTEKPKVIKETVVKEVIKSVKTSSILENIYKGVAHKLIIVTGDRGSGVTSTAWSLARHFSEKCNVLYLDCDTVTHGLMSYIDYFDFKNYEATHFQGVKLCRNSRAFKSCVCKLDTNLDILTSDYGVEVSDDELILTQGVVAENLTNYGVVVVDCPISKLHCIQDLILTGNVVVCVEATRRGYMNALIGLEDSELPLRYKRSIVNKGTILRTKLAPKFDYKRLEKYITSIVDLDECNWLQMVNMDFNGKITSSMLTEILEG